MIDKKLILNKIDKNDFRGLDVSKYDFLDWQSILSQENKNLMFDSKTIFPNSVKKQFQTRLENAKTRGPYIAELHNKGYTGKGITVAIIDHKLRTTHNDIKNNIIHYEEIGKMPAEPEMHGPAVSSILCGKNGILPDAKLVYFATPSGENFSIDNDIKAIYKIIEYNKTLPEENKIKVISISSGLCDGKATTEEKLKEAISVCRDNDIFIAFTGIRTFYNIPFVGTDRIIDSDLNDTQNYKECIFFSERKNIVVEDAICVPQDRITLASHTGDNDYFYDTQGGMSWAVPYFAGIYALAKNIDKSMTPKKFYDLALSTGDNVLIRNGKNSFINPVKIVKSLEFEKSNNIIENKLNNHINIGNVNDR